MPRIKVIIKGSPDVIIEGATDANWYDSNLGYARTPSGADILIVSSLSEGNGKKDLARFKASEVIGFVIDPT